MIAIYINVLERYRHCSDLEDYRQATLSDLLSESSSLTPEMVLRMEKAFHRNMDVLLRMQAWHDAAETRKPAGKIKVDPYVAA